MKCENSLYFCLLRYSNWFFKHLQCIQLSVIWVLRNSSKLFLYDFVSFDRNCHIYQNQRVNGIYNRCAIQYETEYGHHHLCCYKTQQMAPEQLEKNNTYQFFNCYPFPYHTNPIVRILQKPELHCITTVWSRFISQMVK